MFAVAVDVEMVGVNGVDDADVRGQLQEGTVELVCFCHEHRFIGVTQHQIAVEVVGDAADEGGHVDTVLLEDMGDHGRGGGFAMGAGDGNGEVLLGNGSQSFGTF